MFYGAPPLIMLQHCLPTAQSLRAIDLYLNDEQAVRLAYMFRTEPQAIRRMSFATVPQSARRMLAAEPIQFCPTCTGSDNRAMRMTRRTQLQGWRITCPLCEQHLFEKNEIHTPSPLCRYWNQALNGQKLFESEAEQGVQNWAPPSDLAQLLLMRRNPRTVSPNTCAERFRVLGAICPEFDVVVANSRIALPSAGKPILPIRLRPALLAAVAMVEREGPNILEALHGHTIGVNRTRFGDLVARILDQ